MRGTVLYRASSCFSATLPYSTNNSILNSCAKRPLFLDPVTYGLIMPVAQKKVSTIKVTNTNCIKLAQISEILDSFKNGSFIRNAHLSSGPLMWSAL